MQTQQYIEEQNTKMININEETLPLAIQKDIKALKAYHKGKLNAPEDCLWYELYGSINASQHGGEITKETADFLRVKYLGFGSDEDFYFNTHSIYIQAKNFKERNE